MAVLWVVCLLFTAPACYTLLKHPQVKTESTTDVADNRCTNCHCEDEHQ